MTDFTGWLCVAVVLLPLIGALLVGLLNQKLPRKAAHFITIPLLGISFLISCFLLYFRLDNGLPPASIDLYTWGLIGTVSIKIGFLIDHLTLLMMVVVSFVSWMVHIYTIGYMIDDPGYRRFFSYISLFTFGMLMLVMSNNFLQLFFGWEMVGLMSYLLIGFWFKRESANRASLKAFLVNRLGDFGFIIGIAAVFNFFGTLDYSTIFSEVDNFAASGKWLELAGIQISPLTFICLFLFMGAMGKSAQMPLHVWLPDSMEGPTPISALIHAATMVTAGVFMVARMSPLFEYSEVALNTVMIIGAITALLTGILGIVQNDIKRIIAYSTLSQLGYMMTAMGASAYAIGIFHLMTHAFFKALLFLGAGSVIIAMHHEQNIWKMGGLKKYMPITYWCMLIGTLALVGFPGFSGFYSKDLIIEDDHLSRLAASHFAYWVVMISVFITALYSFRLFFVVFHGKARMNEEVRSHLKESKAVITLPLIVLAFFSIVVGFLFVRPMFEGFFGDSLVVHPDHNSFELLSSEFTNSMVMFIQGFYSWPFLIAVLGFLVALLCYIISPKIPDRLQKHFKTLYSILKEKYGFDILYESYIAPGFRGLGRICYRFGDQGLIDGLIVNGSAEAVGKLSGKVSILQSGYLYHYAFAMITGFIVLTVWMLWY